MTSAHSSLHATAAIDNVAPLQDYVDIMDFLIKHWKISSMQGLSVEAQKAQEDLMNLLPRFKKLTERQANQTKRKTPVGSPFSWIFNKEVGVIA
jgi:hypothetical protein